ncbi:heavy-metal-associated domain-containing protein [Cupriavidus sp. LEh25]|uniref:heavy-metal-associated domain-containing protein n=1 Tax=Cupriavidus consociatus TaxID=2821357 RepID=UPI001AE349E8|nr:heavy-metal-associated domain-containing protein [Cupriavidus sp. LEh25]
MTCASCVGRVEKALLSAPGVSAAAVNLATEKATVTALTVCRSQRWRRPSTRREMSPSRSRPDPHRRARTGFRQWWPVFVSTLLTLLLLLPMLLQVFGIHWMPPGIAFAGSCAWIPSLRLFTRDDTETLGG